MGMIAQFVEAPDVMQTNLTVPAQLRDQCRLNECNALTWKVPDPTERKYGYQMKLHVQTSWWQEVVDFFLGLFHI
jgi:hypothetical protein